MYVKKIASSYPSVCLPDLRVEAWRRLAISTTPYGDAPGLSEAMTNEELRQWMVDFRDVKGNARPPPGPPCRRPHRCARRRTRCTDCPS